MIKFESKKIHTSNKLEDFKKGVINETVALLAKEFNNKYKERTCKIHPEHVCKIVLTPTPNSKHICKIEKVNFCCKEFEDSIQIDFKE